MKKLSDIRRSIAKMLLASLLLAGATITLSACNTTAGAGEDLSATGHAVTHGAEKVKQGL